VELSAYTTPQSDRFCSLSLIHLNVNLAALSLPDQEARQHQL